MSYAAEIPKEYLRDALHSGALDITHSFEVVRGFVQIFAGEMEALIAIAQCSFLEQSQIDALMKIAAPTRESAAHYMTWLERVTGQARSTDDASKD